VTVEPQKVAAEVSNNGSIHSFDASIILKYLVGVSTPDALVGCWTFLCDSRDFCIDEDPMEYLDFVGLLFGDVTGNYGMPSPELRYASAATIAAGTVAGAVGQVVEVPVILSAADGYYGLQFNVLHPAEHLTVTGVVPSEMASGCLLEWNVEDGQLRIAAASMNGFSGDGEFCRIVYHVDAMPPEGLCVLDVDGARADERPELLTMIDGAITSGATGIDGGLATTGDYHLYPPTPNPLNPATTIRFEIPVGGGAAEVAVYDLSGRLVRTLHSGFATGGSHTVVWGGDNAQGGQVASGTYFVRLHASGRDQTQKVTVVQ
jgi:hypothetical protein